MRPLLAFLVTLLVDTGVPQLSSAGVVPTVTEPSVQLEQHAWMEDGVGNIKTLFFPRSSSYSGSAILVVYRGGVLRMYPDIDSLPQFPGDDPPGNQILLDLSADTYAVYQYSDHGMTSAAIHPNWPETPYVYACYVAKQPGLPSWWGRANQGQRDTYDTFDRCPNIPDFFNEFDCRKRSRLVRVRIEYDQATDTFSNPNGVGEVDQLLLEGFCSESNTHGTGDLLFLDDGNLLFTHGDTGKAEANDPGVISTGELGECSLGPNADIPMPKGAFLSQQPLSLAGKMWAIPPQSQTRNRLLGMDDLEQVAWGFRNPFRFTPGPDNNIFLGDVGYGTAEEVNELVNPSGSAYDTIANYAWPCLEGSTHEEQARKDYLEALDYDICDAIYDDPTASIRPRYEYRGGVMDPQHPSLCTEGRPPSPPFTTRKTRPPHCPPSSRTSSSSPTRPSTAPSTSTTTPTGPSTSPPLGSCQATLEERKSSPIPIQALCTSKTTCTAECSSSLLPEPPRRLPSLRLPPLFRPWPATWACARDGTARQWRSAPGRETTPRVCTARERRTCAPRTAGRWSGRDKAASSAVPFASLRRPSSTPRLRRSSTQGPSMASSPDPPCACRHATRTD